MAARSAVPPSQEIQKRTALLSAPLTLTQMSLSIIKLLSTHLLRQQESLALNMVRRFPHLRGGKLHCLTLTYSNSRHRTTEIRSSTDFSSAHLCKRRLQPLPRYLWLQPLPI